ncbi:MAG: hypothetical protein ACR2NZ_01690 [Rubripirellula sp.]
MWKFIGGFVCGSIFTVVVGGLAAFVFLIHELPNVTSSMTCAPSAEVGEPVELSVTATNDHDEALVLNAIDIDEAFLEGFQVTSVDPEPIEESRSFGMRRWTFGRDVEPGETVEVTFTMNAAIPGHYVGDVDVCNPNEDFTTHVADVVVSDE